MSAAAPEPVLEVAREGGWKSWLPKVILTVLGIALAYFIFSYMASNFGGFEQGVKAAFSMPPVWTLAAIVAAIIAIGVYPLTAPAAIPKLGYVPAFVDRQGGFAISTTIPFGGGPIAVATQYAILARYGVEQRLAAAAVAADALWTYLMTFGAPGVALILLWIFERRTLTGSECGAIPCETIDVIIIIAGARANTECSPEALHRPEFQRTDDRWRPCLCVAYRPFVHACLSRRHHRVMRSTHLQICLKGARYAYYTYWKKVTLAASPVIADDVCPIEYSVRGNKSPVNCLSTELRLACVA